MCLQRPLRDNSEVVASALTIASVRPRCDRERADGTYSQRPKEQSLELTAVFPGDHNLSSRKHYFDGPDAVHSKPELVALVAVSAAEEESRDADTLAAGSPSNVV